MTLETVKFLNLKNKSALSIVIINLLILCVFQFNIYGQEIIYENEEYFSDSFPKDNFAGDWSASKKIFYTVKEEDGNRFLDVLKAQHIDYFINESPKYYGMRDFSLSFKVKFLEFDNNSASLLSLGFRANDQSNSYLLTIGDEYIQFLDMDQVDENYLNLPNHRKVIAENKHDIQLGSWYQINLISETVEPFKRNIDKVTIGGVRNIAYINGELMLDVIDNETWFEGGMFYLYAWNVSAHIDEIFISSDLSKYRPESQFDLYQKFYLEGPEIKETSSNDKSKEESEENEKIERGNLIYGLIFITALLGLLGLLSSILLKRKNLKE